MSKSELREHVEWLDRIKEVDLDAMLNAFLQRTYPTWYCQVS